MGRLARLGRMTENVPTRVCRCRCHDRLLIVHIIGRCACNPERRQQLLEHLGYVLVPPP
jgi:hypothetical protein